MASLDSLPGDQRAVLELVVRRGRSYDEIGRLLSIDRAAVRARALAAFDALGPQTTIAPERRALITDYLLRQLPSPVTDQVTRRLSESPEEREWALALAGELRDLSSEPLPEIPPDAQAEPAQSEGSRRPISRRGGAVLLGVGALLAVAVAAILITSGGSPRTNTTSAKAASTTASTAAPAPGTSTPAPASATAPSTTTSPLKIVAQVKLLPPSGLGAAKGAARVVSQGSTSAVLIVASGLAPNTKHNAYAVWLYNSPTDNLRLGFYDPGVGSNGLLKVLGGLPSNAASFKHLLLTLEPEPAPAHPSRIVLEGAFKIP